MNLNKINIIRSLMLLLLVCSLNVFAEVEPYKTYETSKLKMKLSNDGTGVVQGIQCSGCDYSIVKITKDSRFTARGVDVDITEAQKRSGKSAMISFTPSTREVQFIRWQCGSDNRAEIIVSSKNN